MNLVHLFKPRSVAIIGASRDPNKIGHTIVANIRSGGFEGKTYPINPFAKKIAGLTVYPSIAAIPGRVDLVIIAIPASRVVEQIIACGKKGIRSVVVISAGFEEIGGEGITRDAQLRAACKRYHIDLLGPNCLGLITTACNFNASFSIQNPNPGGISFVSQSGALMVALIDWSRQAGVGIRSMISLGNQSGIQETDVLEYLAHDPGTKAIGLYLEEINDAYALSRSIARISGSKPIVVLKSGVSPAGQRAVSSHTGSLASEPKVVSYILRQSGALQATDIEDLFNLLKIYDITQRRIDPNIAIVSNAGGPSVITTDLIAQTPLHVAPLTEITQKRLRLLLPEGVSVANPVDLMGDADLLRFQKALSHLVRHSTVRTIFVIVTPQTVTPLAPLARYVVRLQKTTQKRIIACFIGGASVESARTILARGAVLNFKFPSDAIRSLALRAKYESLPRTSIGPARKIVRSAPGGTQLSYPRLQRLFQKERIPLIRGRLLRSERDVVLVRDFPVVFKIMSNDIVHKDAAQGVVLGIRNAHEAVTAFRDLKRRFAGIPTEGILAQPMVLDGSEWFIGLKQDQLLGALVLVGTGGTSVESHDDAVLGLAPIDIDRSIRLIRSVQASQKLSERQIRDIARVLSRISHFTTRYPWIRELDLNPIKLTRKGGVIVDARIIGSR